MANYKTKLPVQYAPHLTTNIRTGVKKVTAHIVEKDEYTIDMLAAEIATATTVTRPDVKAVIDALVDISMRHLCEGHRRRVGGKPRLRSKAGAACGSGRRPRAELRVVSGHRADRWKMEDGRWKMEDGRWKM